MSYEDLSCICYSSGWDEDCPKHAALAEETMRRDTDRMLLHMAKRERESAKGVREDG